MYNLEVGSYWRCHSKIANGMSETDVYAKILHVNEAENRVRVMRTTKYGFETLSPATFTISQFLANYDQDEMYT